MTDTTDFPELPGHPEHTTVWTDAEKEVIREYAQWCVQADRESRAPAPLVNFMRELFAVTTHAEAFGDGKVSAKELRDLMNQHAAAPSAHVKCNGIHDEPPCGDPECWAREDPPGLSSAIDIAGVVDPWPLAGIPAAPPAPVADDVRAALVELADKWRSRIKGETRDDAIANGVQLACIIELEEAARRALSAQQEGGKP